MILVKLIFVDSAKILQICTNVLSPEKSLSKLHKLTRQAKAHIKNVKYHFIIVSRDSRFGEKEELKIFYNIFLITFIDLIIYNGFIFKKLRITLKKIKPTRESATKLFEFC